MKNLQFVKTVLSLLVFSILIVSCGKENMEEIEEQVVETTYEMKVTLRGQTSEYDAYAAYCNENDLESFSVSNNKALLGNEIWTEEMAEGDFVIHYRKDANGEFSLGGTIIETTVDGQVLQSLTLTDDSLIDITIDEANSTEVIGSMSGDFLVIIDPMEPAFETVPFSVSFAGEVDADLAPILCQ